MGDEAMPAAVKTEPSEALDLETKILVLCQDNPAGVTDRILQESLPKTEVELRVSALNRLLSQGKLEVLKQGRQLVYRLKDPSAISKVKGADAEEKVVYQIIEEAGSKGIWIRDIRFKSNLLLTQVNKVLKNLESKKLIKAVKSVAASKKKVYMLYNLEPDRSVTGGAWYSDHDFESEFVEVLNQQCYKFLQQKSTLAKEKTSDPISQRNASYASSKDVQRYIAELGISKVELSVEDIESILNTLVHDGCVEHTVVSSAASSKGEPGMVKLYRSVEPIVRRTGLMQMPCGVCPVVLDCHEGGAVSPLTCTYFKEWLEY